MKVKKVLAVVMSLCMAAGVVSYGAPVITQPITAQAADSATSGISFNKTTGVLTLSGTVDGDSVRDFNYKQDVRSIKVQKGTVFPVNCRSLFEDYSNCTDIDISNADTSKVENMDSMFYGCSALTKLDLSSFDTRNVKKMGFMFQFCTKLTTLNVSSFNTSKVTDMAGMFFSCSSLKSLDLSSFDTSSVTSMGSMFSGCTSLTKLDVSSFNTENVTLMYSMFNACFELKQLDISRFDTRNVTEMYAMFAGCSSLTSLDLSGFDTSNVIYLNDMFTLCDKLNTLTLGKNFKKLPQNSYLPNGDGWVNSKAPSKVVSGKDKYAVIENSGKNTYKHLGAGAENTPTYPTNIKVEYSEQYHQVRFTWDKVEGADRYGIAVYLAGKWRIQTQNITGTVYTSPKNLTTGKTYKVAIAARVNGNWDSTNAIKNAVTVTIK